MLFGIETIEGETDQGVLDLDQRVGELCLYHVLWEAGVLELWQRGLDQELEIVQCYAS